MDRLRTAESTQAASGRSGAVAGTGQPRGRRAGKDRELRATSIKEEQTQNTPACDEDKVLELRDQGKCFAGIAKTLGLGRACHANDAFNQALARKPRPSATRPAAGN
jgi:hypothetical protein